MDVVKTHRDVETVAGCFIMGTNVSPCTQRLGKKKRDRENTTLRAEPGYCIIPHPAPHVLEFLSLTCMLRVRMSVCTTQLRAGWNGGNNIEKEKKGAKGACFRMLQQGNPATRCALCGHEMENPP